MKSITNIFLQPTTGSKGDAKIGILNSVPKTALDALSDAQKEAVLKLTGDQEVYVWAIKDGPNNRSYWNQIENGDLVLFDIKRGQIKRAAHVIGKMEMPELVKATWGTEKFQEAFPLVYFFEPPFNPKITLEEFNECTGYHDVKMTQNFRLLDDAKTAAVHDLLAEAKRRDDSPCLPMSETIHSDLAAIGSRKGISGTERKRLCKCRIGQGDFRQGVIDLWEADAIEGIDRTELLRASHIKPWRDCENDKERLDPHNGLLLLPNHDHLFDQGWITFDSTGRIQLSKQFTDRDYEALGITEDIKIKIQSERMQQYLDFHSKHLFKP